MGDSLNKMKRSTYDPEKRAFWRIPYALRTNDIPTVAKSLQITSGAVICVEAEIRGNVTIGGRSVVHPCARILATKGPIVIGESNLIEELVVIENLRPEPLIIGNSNVFEVGASVRAARVGDNNIFEMKCHVGPSVCVGNGCIFGAVTNVDSAEKFPDNSVFYGDPLKHRVAAEKPTAQNQQIEFLGKILPNYHHVRAPLT